MHELLLALNAGSSSLKFAIFQAANLRLLYRGGADAHEGEPALDIESAGRKTRRPLAADRSFQQGAIEALTDWLEAEGIVATLAGAGHRVVTGGTAFTAPMRIDGDVLERMKRLVDLAPLHVPQNLSAVERLGARLPNLPQVACFDTAFHAGQSPLVRTYGLPRELTRQGYVRYGFHGLSYEYIASRMSGLFDARTARGRVIVAHLGNGGSLCALENGRSVATTMGYSTLEGLVMGTRCGSLDPGLVLTLIRERGGDLDAIEHMLYHESGLKGVSGVSNDMRELLASEDNDARFAVDLFVHRIQREIGSLVAALRGLDALVFTGGMGARSPAIRARVVEGLDWLGARLDTERNEAGNERLEHTDSRVALAAVMTDEEVVVARGTRDVLEHSKRL